MDSPIARINQDTGCPELVIRETGEVITSSYVGLAAVQDGGVTYICASQFWEGVLPTGVLLKAVVVR